MNFLTPTELRHTLKISRSTEHRFLKHGMPSVNSGRLRRYVQDEAIEWFRNFAYVSLRRNKQFGLIQPSTKTRVDVGINLKGAKPSGRLEASGSFNSMVSHRVRLSKKKEHPGLLAIWMRMLPGYEKMRSQAQQIRR